MKTLEDIFVFVLASILVLFSLILTVPFVVLTSNAAGTVFGLLAYMVTSQAGWPVHMVYAATALSFFAGSLVLDRSHTLLANQARRKNNGEGLNGQRR